MTDIAVVLFSILGLGLTMLVALFSFFVFMRNDSKELKADLTKQIDNVRVDLTKQIDIVKIDLIKQIDNVKIDLKEDIKEIKEDISKLDNRIDRLEKGQMVLREAIVEVKASINHQNMHIYGYKPNEQETGKTEKRI